MLNVGRSKKHRVNITIYWSSVTLFKDKNIAILHKSQLQMYSPFGKKSEMADYKVCLLCVSAGGAAPEAAAVQGQGADEEKESWNIPERHPGATARVWTKGLWPFRSTGKWLAWLFCTVAL